MMLRQAIFLIMLFPLIIYYTLPNETPHTIRAISAKAFLDYPKKVDNNTHSIDNPHSVFILNKYEADKYFHSYRILTISDFPVNEINSGTIELEEMKPIIDANTKILTTGLNGENELKHPQTHSYRGIIKGEIGSFVILNYINGFLIGSIVDEQGNTFIIGPSKDAEFPNEHVIRDIRNFTSMNEQINKLLKNDYLDLHPDKNIEKKPHLSSDELLELELAVETDTEFFKATGSDINKAEAYILALLAHVSLIYEKYINTTIYLIWIKIWTDKPPDPYDAGGDYSKLLDRAIPYWRDNYSDVERDVYHVVTSIGYGGGGFGYFNALCGKKDYGMSVTSLQCWNNLPTFNFSYDVYIVSHELGHNFNAQHTHSCFWNNAPLDTCVVDTACLDKTQQPKPNPGSIMSYCGGINNQNGLGYQVRMIFLPQNVAIMRKTAEEAECLTAPPEPAIYLLSPHGEEYYSAGDVIQIIWTSSRVGNISLQYLDARRADEWTDIASDIPSGNKPYDWTLPDICSNKIYVKIFDELNHETADTSMLPLTIHKEDPEQLRAYYPFNGNSHDEQLCGYFDTEGINNPILVPDRFGFEDRAYKFDGTNYLKADNFDAAFDQLTVSVWFKPDDLTGKRNIIGTNYQEGWVFEIYFWGQLGVSYYIDNHGVPAQIWGGGITKDEWHHIVFTFDGKFARLYLDGALKTENSDDSTHSLNKFAKTPLYIGSREEKDFFIGSIDDIRIYNRALKEEEVLALYNEVKTLPQPPVLVSPEDGADNQPENITLMWNPVGNATKYQLQAGTDIVANDYKVNDSNITYSQYNIKYLIPNTTYQWRVAAINDNGRSPWSAIREFRTADFNSITELQSSLSDLLIYPNPAADIIYVRFGINKTRSVILGIYNQLGIRIKTFINELLEPGIYDYKFSINELESSAYLIKLQTGNCFYAKRAIILK